MNDPATYQIKAHGPHGENLGYGNRGSLKSYRKHGFDYNSCVFLLTDNFRTVILEVLSSAEKSAGVAELVYAYVSEAYGESLESSNLSSGTI